MTNVITMEQVEPTEPKSVLMIDEGLHDYQKLYIKAIEELESFRYGNYDAKSFVSTAERLPTNSKKPDFLLRQNHSINRTRKG